MGKMLKIPDRVYEDLKSAAKSSGVTPAGWIKARLPKKRRARQIPVPSGRPNGETLYDLLAPYIGSVKSKNGESNLSRDCGKKFTDYLVEKRKAGHL